MKKIITVLILAMTALSFAACSKSETEKKDEQLKIGLSHFKGTHLSDDESKYKNPPKL